MTLTKTDEKVRTEFGFTRTECACSSCSINCRFIPGYLVPSDVKRIARHLGYTNLGAFASENLLASPGATVMSNGRVFQIPTLVPQRRADGACKFLDADNRCRVHTVSPFGCAYFDAHQPSAEADRRSSRGLQDVARHWSAGASVYAVLWKILDTAGLRAVPAHIARARMREAADKSRDL